MAALDFPDTPSIDQVYDKWTWNGTVWTLNPSGGSGGGGGIDEGTADARYLDAAGDTATGDIRGTRFGLIDTDASHHMMLKLNSNLTAERELLFVTGDAGRTLQLDANVALNQNLRTTDAPTFSRVKVIDNPGIVMNSRAIYLKTEGDAVHQLYANDLSAAVPFADGPMLIGYSGWAHYNNFNGWAMGWRGATTYPYLWANGSLVVGSQPNDGLIPSAGKIYSSGLVSAEVVESRKTAGTNFDQANLIANRGNYGGGAVSICSHPGGQATQLRQAYNDASMYFRNGQDTAYPIIYMDVSDASSVRYKQDVIPFVDHRARGTERSALSVVRALKPVSYRWEFGSRMSKANGDPHVCNAECIGPDNPNYTPENTCPQFRQWERGVVGFTAEDIDAVLPEASVRNAHDEPEGVKTLAIVAVLTDALQELIERIELLEGGA